MAPTASLRLSEGAQHVPRFALSRPALRLIGEVFANSAFRGDHFGRAVRAKGGIPRVIATDMWGEDTEKTLARLAAYNRPIHRVRGGSRRSPAPGSAAMACAECDGTGLPKPPSKFVSPPSPITRSPPRVAHASTPTRSQTSSQKTHPRTGLLEAATRPSSPPGGSP